MKYQPSVMPPLTKAGGLIHIEIVGLNKRGERKEDWLVLGRRDAELLISQLAYLLNPNNLSEAPPQEQIPLPQDPAIGDYVIRPPQGPEERSLFPKTIKQPREPLAPKGTSELNKILATVKSEREERAAAGVLVGDEVRQRDGTLLPPAELAELATHCMDEAAPEESRQAAFRLLTRQQMPHLTAHKHLFHPQLRIALANDISETRGTKNPNSPVQFMPMDVAAFATDDSESSDSLFGGGR